MTDQTISVLDQGDFARFDDDGGAPTRLRLRPTGSPIRPAHPTSGVSGGGPRLSVTPVRGRGSVDGAWWPRTLNLADELPGLVAALSTTNETITRVSVNGDIWTDIPNRVAQPGRPALRVSWFRTMDPHVVTLGGGNRPRISILVISPDAAAGPASEVLRLATAGWLAGTPARILRGCRRGGAGMTGPQPGAPRARSPPDAAAAAAARSHGPGPGGLRSCPRTWQSSPGGSCPEPVYSQDLRLKIM
jgi:hypothetical protein